MTNVPAWKDDFPISWVDDHFVTRREFTKSLVWVSCASFAATALLSAKAAGSRRLRPFPALKVADADELAVGESRVFGYPEADEPCLLIRLDTDTFVAFGQKCTHLGCPVVYEPEPRELHDRGGAASPPPGPLLRRSESGSAACLHCPCHEGFFSVADGSVLAGPPPRPLPRIELEKRGRELWAVGVRL